MRNLFGVLLLNAGLALVGCDTSPLGTGQTTGDAGAALVGSHDGMTCEVANLLQSRCDSCHGSTNPRAGLPLVTYADLSAASPLGGSQTVADLCLSRMKDAASPMPPSGALPSAEIAAFEKWITDGLPKGTCATTTDDPVACTSGQTNTSSQESADMRPGRACIACHASDGEAPMFTLAGTVYPTFHEPDLCVSQVVSAQVIVTDKAGKKVTMAVSAGSGNFSSYESIQFPITAEVLDSAGKTRAMATGVGSGDCNGCHTQTGTQGAPGRVRMP